MPEIRLTDGNDTFIGTPSGETILGLGGSDRLSGGGGADSLAGGSGNDTVRATGADATLAGGDGVDTLVADLLVPVPTENAETVRSQAALSGGSGADTLHATATISLPESFDVFANVEIDQVLNGQAGNDDLLAQSIVDQQRFLDGGLTVRQSLAGEAGDDTLTARPELSALSSRGEVTLDGGTGNDRLLVETIGSGAQFASVTIRAQGGDGADILIAGDGTLVALDGGAGNDTLDGTAGVLSGEPFSRDGRNEQQGGTGDDVMRATLNLAEGIGANVMDGGSGNDNLFASSLTDDIGSFFGGLRGGGSNTLLGGEGADTVSLEGGAEGVLDGGTGDDVLSVRSILSTSPDFVDVPEYTVRGGDGNDRLIVLGDSSSTLQGGAGTDTVSFADYNFSLGINLATGVAAGGGVTATLTGIENVIGGGAGDTLSGSSGANLLDGSAGTDVIFAGGGDDLIIGGVGSERLFGQEGVDTVSYAGLATGGSFNLGALTARVSGDNQVLNGIENLTGTQGSDRIFGSALDNRLAGAGGDDTLQGWEGDDVLNGGAGDDLLFAGPGADTFIGGEGIDTLSFAALGSGGRFDLTTGVAVAGGATDRLQEIENLIGGSGADLLVGNGSGNRLTGGGGSDTLTGNAGLDVFTFSGTGNGTDRITDFTNGVDRIAVQGYGPALDSFADLDIRVAGGNTLIDLGADVAGAGVIVLAGVTAGLDASDFLFS